MSDYYTESQVNRIEQNAHDGAILEAGKEWERQRDEFNSIEHELETRIAELEQAQRWIPVSERLPEEYRIEVLALSHGAPIIASYITKYDMWYAPFVDRLSVTHWMPIPQPPEDK